jgi:type II secretory pathway component PulL
MSVEKYYHLSDSSIGQIAKLVQIAILTGTDVVDHLRLMKFDSDDGILSLTAEYDNTFNDQVDQMIKENPINTVTLIDKTDDSDSVTGKLTHWEREDG